jgi:hypothetical protein
VSMRVVQRVVTRHQTLCGGQLPKRSPPMTSGRLNNAAPSAHERPGSGWVCEITVYVVAKRSDAYR